MTILVDASALVSLATKEPDHETLMDRLDEHDDRLCCAVGIWEAALAITRRRETTVAEGRRELASLIRDLRLRVVAIGELEGELSMDAFVRYGKGTGHPAQLNIGDCFAYACAKANDAALLYKGNDFSRTDLA